MVSTMEVDVTANYRVLGVPISVTNPDDAASRIEGWARDDVGRFVCIRDVASLMAIKDDPEIRHLHEEAAMVTPDGMPIAVLGKLKGLPVEQTCGADLMDLLCSRSVDSGLSHYFYGGKDGVAEKLAGVMQKRFPGLKIAGWECPPFRAKSDEETRETIERIEESGADVVWVGLSSPKQDVWMMQNYQQLSQTLIGVGAAFDFHTGSVRRAPPWMRKAMLEWAYRLASEPRRLWRRYLVLAPRFVFEVISETLTRRRSRSS